LLTNGNFETGPFNTWGAVAGWTVSGPGKIEIAAEGATSPTHSAAFSTGGDTQGNVLSQDIATSNGQIYYVDFDTAIFGIRTGAPLQIRVQVSGKAILLDQTITPPDAGAVNAGAVSFQHYHFVFTADRRTATLQFTNVGLGNANADPVVDSVYVGARP
jgi:hypothetical protein